MLQTSVFFFFQAEDGIRDKLVTGFQTCALPIFASDAGAVTNPAAGVMPTRPTTNPVAAPTAVTLPVRTKSRHAQVTSAMAAAVRSEEHTSELQSLAYLVCRLLLEKKKKTTYITTHTNT